MHGRIYSPEIWWDGSDLSMVDPEIRNIIFTLTPKIQYEIKQDGAFIKNINTNEDGVLEVGINNSQESCMVEITETKP